jgi:hypothetical protein
MRSLLDFFHKKREEEELECPVFNPLSLNFNNIIEITSQRHLGKEWKITAIEEYRREIENQTFYFADYLLQNTLNKSDQIKLRSYDDNKDSVILLSKFDSRGYNPDLHSVLKDTDQTGLFNVTDDNNEEVEFFRINRVKNPWNACVTKISDIDGDRKFTKNDPVEKAQIEYWDFWRSVDINPLPIMGEKQTEYLFCEMDLDSGWFTFWRGFDTDPQLILII